MDKRIMMRLSIRIAILLIFSPVFAMIRKQRHKEAEVSIGWIS